MVLSLVPVSERQRAGARRGSGLRGRPAGFRRSCDRVILRGCPQKPAPDRTSGGISGRGPNEGRRRGRGARGSPPCQPNVQGRKAFRRILTRANFRPLRFRVPRSVPRRGRGSADAVLRAFRPFARPGDDVFGDLVLGQRVLVARDPPAHRNAGRVHGIRDRRRRADATSRGRRRSRAGDRRRSAAASSARSRFFAVSRTQSSHPRGAVLIVAAAAALRRRAAGSRYR